MYKGPKDKGNRVGIDRGNRGWGYGQGRESNGAVGGAGLGQL